MLAKNFRLVAFASSLGDSGVASKLIDTPQSPSVAFQISSSKTFIIELVSIIFFETVSVFPSDDTTDL